MLNLPIWSFLPPAVRKCPLQGSPSPSPPSALSKSYRCLDCSSPPNKRQRWDYHFISFHTLSFKWEAAHPISLKTFPAWLLYFFLRVKGVAGKSGAQRWQRRSPLPACLCGWFCNGGRFVVLRALFWDVNVSLIALLSLFVSCLGANFLPHLVHINARGSPDSASLSRPSFLETNFRQQWLAVISGTMLIDFQA